MSDLKTINQIRDAMLQHFEDDKGSFAGMESSQQSIRDSIEHIKHLLDDMKLSIDSLATESRPMLTWFQGMTFGKKALMWTLTLVGSIVAIAIGLKSLFSK